MREEIGNYGIYHTNGPLLSKLGGRLSRPLITLSHLEYIYPLNEPETKLENRASRKHWTRTS